ncbi:MAG: Xaa-Pro aminopeptidase [Bdellovibrionales bacterium CG10_big_fil_rev_8_21_14_0_10_45_34]|nr:MAG: Xaa-Pro aminopeptidase [Bdellovibrionales bacterium CG10_big_fil_rev_8_21_14_0_10_45_34]
MRQPQQPTERFVERRNRLRQSLQERTAFIVSAAFEKIRNEDAHFLFRQNSSFFYLTGFDEPEALFVFRPWMSPEAVMFVREKNLERETWDGFRFGPDLAKKAFAMDECYLTTQIDEKLPELIADCEQIYFSLQDNFARQTQILEAVEKARLTRGRTSPVMASVMDPRSILAEMRLIKSPEEQELQRKACHVTALGHRAAMQAVQPGWNERQLQGIFQYAFAMNQCPVMGYNPIIGGGENATILHYNFNDQVLNKGDLVLCDVGAEWNFFSGDITRTFPVSGKFSAAQKDLYQAVLDVQKWVITQCKPGTRQAALQKMTIEKITDALLQLKLLRGDKEEIIEKQGYRRYYMHGVSHWLGMDVHDLGTFSVNGEERAHAPGMCLTVEPGIYIRTDDELAPKELRGLGVRIEDDILITENGCEVMTSAAPKEVAEIESLMAEDFDPKAYFPK